MGGAPPPRPFGALLLPRLAGDAGLSWLGQEPAALHTLASYFGDGPSELRAITCEAERRIGLIFDRGPASSAAPPGGRSHGGRPGRPATTDRDSRARGPPRAHRCVRRGGCGGCGGCARHGSVPRSRRTGSRSTPPRRLRVGPARTRTLRGVECSACPRDRVPQDGPEDSPRSAEIAGQPLARCLHRNRRGRAAGSGGAKSTPESDTESRKATAGQPACKTRRNARHQQADPAQEPGDVPGRGRPERVECRLEIAGEKRSERLRAVDFVEDRGRRASHPSRVMVGRQDVDGQSARRA